LPISESSLIVSESGSKSFKPFCPKITPANSNPTSPGNFKRSNIGGTVKITVNRIVKAIMGVLVSKFEPICDDDCLEVKIELKKHIFLKIVSYDTSLI
jgi:hypothetical protein